MAKIEQGTLHDFVTGQTVTEPMLDQNFEIVRVAINDNDSRLNNTYTKAEVDERTQSAALDAHKVSGDHDYRYYQKAEVDSKISTAAFTKSIAYGTAFPTTSLIPGQEFFRTDYKRVFIYDGVDWIDKQADAEILAWMG